MQPIDLVKSHAAGGRIPRASYIVMYATAAVFVVACIIAAWSLRTSPWMQDPTDLEARLAYVRDNGHAGEAQPEILVLGSSRPAFGINSFDLAEATGRPRLAAANLAFPGFRPQAMLRQIEAEPQKLMAAKEWIIGIDDYYLLQEYSPPKDEPILKRAESAVASWMAPALKLNAMGRELERNIGISLGWNPPLSLAHWTMGDDGSWDEPRLSTRVVNADADRPVFQSILDSYFKFAGGINPQAVQELERIIAVAKEKGIKVILVSMPYHTLYDTMAKSEYPGLLQKTVHEVRRIAADTGVQFIDCRQAAQNCGVSDNDFADPVHLNDAGSAKITAYLASHIR